MKKKDSLWCFIIAGLLVLGYAIRLVADYAKYDPNSTSAPFSTYVLIRGLEFIIPCILLIVVGILIRIKGKDDIEDREEKE